MDGTIKRRKQIDWKKYVFFFFILVIPITQFLVFYVFINFRMITMSFERYENGEWIWNNVQNYKDFFFQLKYEDALGFAIKNSLLRYGLSLIITMPVSIIVAYYIYIKITGSEVFKVLLMIPSLISSVVFVLSLQIIMYSGFDIRISNPENQWTTILCYGLFFSVAANLVLYIGAMNGVDENVMEYAEIDGLGTLGKLYFVVVPSIWPTISVFIVTGFAGFFTDQGATYKFFDVSAHDSAYTLGYWLYLKVAPSAYGGGSPIAEYPMAATAGIIFTLIAAPVTIILRRLLERFGPRED